MLDQNFQAEELAFSFPPGLAVALGQTNHLFPKASWNFSLVFLWMKLTAGISPGGGLGLAGEVGYHTENISSECHRLSHLLQERRL